MPRKGQGHFTTIRELSDCCHEHGKRIADLERDVIDLSIVVLEAADLKVGARRTELRRRLRRMKLRR